ncbi:hypothetical protein HOY80DRAFT_1134761 [Tuber brumale]|nr:hypothetical protein HOY80DRAFT_1134761 [Tuber brumale]
MPHLVDGDEDIGGSKDGAQVHPYQLTMSLVGFAWERGANTTPAKGPGGLTGRHTKRRLYDSCEHRNLARKAADGKTIPLNSNIPAENTKYDHDAVISCIRLCHSVPHIPERTEDIIIDETHCDDLIAPVSSISDDIRLGHRTRKQACYPPIPNLGRPGSHHIGQTGTESLLMATGHWCWGINNAPATLKLSSQNVFEGKAVSLDMRQARPDQTVSNNSRAPGATRQTNQDKIEETCGKGGKSVVEISKRGDGQDKNEIQVSRN